MKEGGAVPSDFVRLYWIVKSEDYEVGDKVNGETEKFY